jgi:hypothetical protein
MLSNRELAESHLAQSILYLRRERTDSADALAEELQSYVTQITKLPNREEEHWQRLA